jgi:antirestriction protein ArdC
MTNQAKPTSTRSPSPRRDLYAEVTQKLIAQIERNPGEPTMPWRRTGGAPLWMPQNALTDAHYRGINVITLWGAAEEKGYRSNIWATYKQYQELGAQVRGGEKSALVIKYGEYEVEPKDGDPLDDGKRLFAKAAYVFNAEQVDNFALPAAPEPLPPIERIARAKDFIANTGAVIKIGGERAFYRPSTDEIHMPDEALFTGTDTMSRSESWHAVEAHEAIHWTSHTSRLNRELGKRFGDRAYQAEELVAEIGSAMVCAMLEITQDVRPDHAQYLSHWLELMKSDPKAIFTAASKASQAVDYLVSLQPQRVPDTDPPPNDPRPEPATTTDQDRAPHRDDAAIARRGRRRPPEAKR